MRVRITTIFALTLSPGLSMRAPLITAALISFASSALAMDVHRSPCVAIANDAIMSGHQITQLYFDGMRLGTGTIGYGFNDRMVYVSHPSPTVIAARVRLLLEDKTWIIFRYKDGVTKPLEIIAAGPGNDCLRIASGTDIKNLLSATDNDQREPFQDPFTGKCAQFLREDISNGAKITRMLPGEMRMNDQLVHASDGEQQHSIRTPNPEVFINTAAALIRGSWMVKFPSNRLGKPYQKTQNGVTMRWVALGEYGCDIIVEEAAPRG